MQAWSQSFRYFINISAFRNNPLRPFFAEPDNNSVLNPSGFLVSLASKKTANRKNGIGNRRNPVPRHLCRCSCFHHGRSRGGALHPADAVEKPPFGDCLGHRRRLRRYVHGHGRAVLLLDAPDPDRAVQHAAARDRRHLRRDRRGLHLRPEPRAADSPQPSGRISSRSSDSRSPTSSW